MKRQTSYHMQSQHTDNPVAHGNGWVWGHRIEEKVKAIQSEIGENLSGICIKDTWTKPKEGRINGGK